VFLSCVSFPVFAMNVASSVGASRFGPLLALIVAVIFILDRSFGSVAPFSLKTTSKEPVKSPVAACNARSENALRIVPCAFESCAREYGKLDAGEVFTWSPTNPTSPNAANAAKAAPNLNAVLDP